MELNTVGSISIASLAFSMVRFTLRLSVRSTNSLSMVFCPVIDAVLSSAGYPCCSPLSIVFVSVGLRSMLLSVFGMFIGSPSFLFNFVIALYYELKN